MLKHLVHDISVLLLAVSRDDDFIKDHLYIMNVTEKLVIYLCVISSAQEMQNSKQQIMLYPKEVLNILGL